MSRIKLDFGPPVDTPAAAKLSADFVDVAGSVGLNFSYFNDSAKNRLYLPETLGGGAAALDYDLDGWCDVYFANGRTLPAEEPQGDHLDRLFRNHAGHYRDITEVARLWEPDFSHGVAVGDLNLDGFEDLLVANFGHPRVFLNQGDGTYRELAVQGLRSKTSFWVAPLFVDLNNDGLEDLLLVSYVNWNCGMEPEMYAHGPGYPSPGQFDGGPYLVLQNHGDLSFSDRTSSWGFSAAAKCLGIAAADLDHDLRPEVYVANDGMANACYTQSEGAQINSRVTNATRPGSIREFTSLKNSEVWHDIAERSGTAGSDHGLNEASMCVTFADFTRNGWPDVFVTNYYLKKNTLYANKGHLSFRDTSRAVRLDIVGSAFTSFGAVPLDVDLDGWWDIFVANGHVIGPNAPVNEMPCQLLHNWEGVFFDVSEYGGVYFQQTALGRSVITLDSKNRGLPNVVITYTDRPISLVENQAKVANAWLCLEVVDPQHTPLTGGRIELIFSNHRVVIPMSAGGSYIGENQKRWTLGLGPHAEMPVVQVHWVNGHVDRWEKLEPNMICRLAPRKVQRYQP